MSHTVFVTGVAGAGKSTLNKYLRSLGYSSFDFEEEPDLFYQQGDKWLCDKKKLEERLAREKDAISFVCGVSANTEELLDLFDTIFVLHASADVTRHRLTHRDHPYGKEREVQEYILSWKDDWERYMQEHGAIPIDADVSVEEVAIELMRRLPPVDK